jgi:hypothetical protein
VPSPILNELIPSTRRAGGLDQLAVGLFLRFVLGIINDTLSRMADRPPSHMFIIYLPGVAWK